MARQARGAARRAALVEAAARVLDRDGFAAVSHRSVAAEAQVPLGSTTYYFSGREELVGAALDAWLSAEEQRLTTVVAALARRRRSPRARAELVVEVLIGRDRAADQSALVRYYERFVEAGRLRAHRPRLARSRTTYDALLAEVLTRSGAEPEAVDVRLLTAVTDGSLLNALIDGAPDPWEQTVTTVERALRCHGAPN